MDLTVSYMEMQGTMEYVHEIQLEREYLIGYANEGEPMQYLFCSEKEADEKMKYWKKTGKVSLYDALVGITKVETPSMLMMLRAGTVFVKRSEPP